MTWNERNYWNMRTYGQAISIKKSWIKGIIMFMSVAIPVAFPVPVALVICRYIKNDIIYRW